jgi:glucose/arabinose dehydrogenase
MKIISKLKLFSAVIVSIMMLIGANSFALKGNHKGVPNIGSMIIMSGLENPWDIAFTNDGKAMFFTEKSQGLSVKAGGSVNKLYGIKGSSGYAYTK